MGKKNLIISIIAEQGFIRNIGEDGAHSEENEILFNAISETYIPLLNLINKFEEEKLPVKFAMVLSPQLCALLDDAQLQQKYIEYLEGKIALAEKEVARNKNKEELKNLSQEYLEKARQTLFDYTSTYGQKLVSAFHKAAKKGLIELTATSATYSYLPHYADLTEALNAQIETGLLSQRYYFGEVSEGFYLPHLGYANGLDKVLRSYGINYTIVEAKSFLFSNDRPVNGIFTPMRTDNSLVLFARDPDTPEDITGDEGYALNPIYRCQSRDIGYQLPLEDLEPMVGKENSRIATGLKYWTNEAEDDVDSDEGPYYDSHTATEQAKKDALDFYQKKEAKLLKAAELVKGQDVDLVLTIPAEILGQSWYEGMTFLEEVLRLTVMGGKLELAFCKDLISEQFSLSKFTPYPCSAAGEGYGEDLLDDSNKWMFRYIRKATERMIDLTERFPAETGLKERLLNLGTKEVLLAQSSDWPLMLAHQQLPDFAEQMFTKNIISFTNVFDALASNTVSTEWLTNLEKEHSLFPWINYKIFSRKK